MLRCGTPAYYPSSAAINNRRSEGITGMSSAEFSTVHNASKKTQAPFARPIQYACWSYRLEVFSGRSSYFRAERNRSCPARHPGADRTRGIAADRPAWPVAALVPGLLSALWSCRGGRGRDGQSSGGSTPGAVVHRSGTRNAAGRRQARMLRDRTPHRGGPDEADRTSAAAPGTSHRARPRSWRRAGRPLISW